MPALAAALLFSGFLSAFETPAWIALLMGAVAAGRFAASGGGSFLADRLAAVAGFFAAAFAGFASGRPLEGLSIACGVLFGEGFALARRAGWSVAGGTHAGVAGAFLGFLAAAMAAQAWGWMPGEIDLDGYLGSEFARLRAAALAPGAPIFGENPQLSERAEEFFRDEKNRFALPKMFVAVWTLAASLMAIGWTGPRRPLGARLARYKANERQIPLLIAALLAYLAAPKLGAGAGFQAWAKLFLHAAATLLWLQAWAVVAWTIRRGGRTENRALAATGWFGAALIVSSNAAGLVLGFADAYLDIRKHRPRLERG